MLLRWFVCCAIVTLAGPAIGAEPTQFPAKPIRLVVYTRPGGSIDTTARKFVDIAAKYTDATFVVQNKPGAGGIVAMKDVLQAKPDGYTLLACTKSNVAKIVATGDTSLVDSFHWAAMLMSDPECVITRRDIRPSTWAELVADSRPKNGRQIWVGPAYGGSDHVMAMKTWEKSGIGAIWVPFQSGGKAKAELLGGRCVAYVGNPSEIRTNPGKLMVAAVAGHDRLSQFPEVPTFGELGIEGLADEVMWRGFAWRKGVPPSAIVWYETLFRKVSADNQWRAFYERDGIDVGYRDAKAFTATVLHDHQEFENYLGQLGILRSDVPAPFSRFVGGWYPLALLVFMTLACLAVLRARSDVGVDVGEAIIPIVLLLFGLLLFSTTLLFPRSDEVGAAAVPRLWLAALLPLCVVLLRRTSTSVRLAASHTKESDRGETMVVTQAPATTPSSATIQAPATVLPLFFLLFAYVPALMSLGYFISTFLFLSVAMFLLGERKRTRILGVTVGWLAFSYVVFARLLLVPLPSGKLLERLF